MPAVVFPSSGVHWGPDLVVTADHTISRDEDIRVTLPDGRMPSMPGFSAVLPAQTLAPKVPGLGTPAVAGSRMKPRRFSVSLPSSSDVR